ncbi:L,D-transpeptidase [Azospirillum sp. ST 5-10]|uniref:L,D-transpeptidase n=1 Tax=unclassified Azospirillum TaxID=2630922 RepID=UPI003F4A16AD
MDRRISWAAGVRRFAAALAALTLLLPVASAAAAEEGGGAAAVRAIVISLADRRLYLRGADPAVRSFPVAIGRPGVAVPLGDTTVVRKRRNPTWHPTANQRRADPHLPRAVPPGPGNPLGRYALDLGWSTYAIHGTNRPDSIGRRASGGCFRMLPADIEALFAAVPVGTPVRVIKEAYAPPDRPPAVVPAGLPATPPPAAPAAPVRPAPPPLLPDPRCPSVTAPLHRMLCDDPELAALDGRLRGLTHRHLEGLPAAARTAATMAQFQDDRRFEERTGAACWIRRGSEADPAVAAAARACLRDALAGRLAELERRFAAGRNERIAGRE